MSETKPRASEEYPFPAEPVSQVRPPPLLEGVGFLSKVTFQWVQPIISRGARREISDENLNDLSTSDQCATLTEKVNQAWKTEKSTRPDCPRLWRLILAISKPHLIRSGAVALVESTTKIAQAAFLGYLVNFFHDPTIPTQHGYLFALGLSLSVILEAFTHHIFYFSLSRMGLNVRVGLSTMIYQKSLRLPASSSMSTGTVINMISNDMQPFETVCYFIHALWMAPYEIALAFYFLWRDVRWSILVGLGVFALMVPLQLLLAKNFAVIRKHTVRARDQRIRLLGDTFTGISTIKLSGWEDVIRDKIVALRRWELGFLRRAALLKSLNEGIFFSSGTIVCAATFISLHYLSHGFQPGQIFTTMTVFYRVRLMVANFVPKLLECMAEARVSAQRIVEFLELPEVNLMLENGPSQGADVAPAGLEDDPSEKPTTGSLGHPARTGEDPHSIPYAVRLHHATLTWDAANGSEDGPATTLTHTSKVRRLNQLSVVSDSAAKGPTGIPKNSTPPTQLTPSSTDEPRSSGPVLRDLHLTLGRDELLGVIGPVGSGKSSLCMSVLGELTLLSGQLDFGTGARQPRVGYSAQVPWIMAGTIRDNILFYAPFDPVWYNTVVECCALATDFTLFADGDLTMVGEKGTNLSGGQRARLSLARAVYQKADLYVLDDPLSAVDPHVARHLFQNVVCGLLAGKPRILVTHQIQFVTECDSVLLLDQGRAFAQGPVDQVMALLLSGAQEDGTYGSATTLGAVTSTSLSTPERPVASALRREDPHSASSQSIRDFVHHLCDLSTLPSGGHPLGRIDPMRPGDNDSASLSGESDGSASPLPSDTSSHLATALPTHCSKSSDDPASSPSKHPTGATGPPVSGGIPSAEAKIGDEETVDEGSPPISLYYRFFRFGSSVGTLCILAALMVGTQVCLLMTDYVLTRWSSMPYAEQHNWRHPALYGGMALLTCALAIVRAVACLLMTLRASDATFYHMLDAVLASPMHFFHVNPQGRILNRFTKDQSSVDEMLPLNMYDATQCLLMVTGAIVVICMANPFIVISVPVILVGFGLLRRYYMLANRVIKRIESASRSPVYSTLSETLDGLGTLRAFGAGRHFSARFGAALDQNSRAYFVFIGASRWLGFRLDFMSAMFLTLAAFVTVTGRAGSNPNLVGLGLVYIIQLLGLLQWMVRQTTEVEILFVAVERMMAYVGLPSEEKSGAAGPLAPPSALTSKPVVPPPAWPDQGAIEFKSLSLRYPGSTAPVLHNISFTARPAEKIGVVGRTGAGKSSLLTALFRLTEPYPAGCIWIDGVDISALGLRALRRRLAIIPQEAFLFHGTLRFNLDPFDQHSDAEIWDALAMCELKPAIERLPDRLESVVTENGKNFSVGERQLFSLCRAVLRRARVIIMDEATANVDLSTDRLIQQTIHTQFAHATILTIAHRLHTVIGDYDRILVLDRGEVQEYGDPWELLQNPHGWLTDMVAKTGPTSAAELRAAAHRKWLQNQGHRV
ncbi:hypothetical protein IWQ60_004759 [Tieghemiomyces parasiticus]|uniref:P-loop containing nucleoside triphosphate hydrolase protein n=1 Tax=Tieghemiomyces parasiticus TaxID=78921 RepID=A0A9W8DZ23_9FUNG|nr:hypothetical protein IWQ60_004759 [Tieghemiomyces parasiticus]